MRRRSFWDLLDLGPCHGAWTTPRKTKQNRRYVQLHNHSSMATKTGVRHKIMQNHLTLPR